jgi:adenylosuccinate synthase
VSRKGYLMGTGAKADIILGVQWGDEGKGRFIDYYAGDYDVVARFGGGDNAGHTLVVGDTQLKLRIVPSGVLHDRPELFIGGGTVVSLEGLADELAMLASHGVDVSRMKISDRAHIVFPYHAELDRLSEKARGGSAIGTTGRGIGPAYIDRTARMGIMVRDLYDPKALIEKIRFTLAARTAQLDGTFRPEDMVAQALAQAERVLPYVVDGVSYIHEQLEAGKRVLIEGAQGTLLDLGYGTYPYVTTSHTIAGGACTGLGIGPTAIGRVIGVAKAYCTRVGAGPFPSELHDDLGEQLRKQGAEFGTVTGRPRRCGWFDAVAARYAARLNGLTDVVLTKLDVLTGLARIGIVRGYQVAGREVGIEAIAEPGLTVDIEWYEGWSEDLGGIRNVAALPHAARRYVAALEEALRAPVAAVSTGPERSALAVA